MGRKGAKSYCRLRDSQVESVRIRKAELLTALDARVAKEGAITVYARVSCDMWTCPYRELCDPLSLASGDKVKVLETERTFPCPSDPSKVLCVARTEPL